MVLIGAAVFLSIELLFLATNATKLLHGAWVADHTVVDTGLRSVTSS